MGSDLLVGLMATPLAIIVWLMIVFFLSIATYRANDSPAPISPLRLLIGYGSAFGVCVVLSAFSAYVSPEDASSIWHVPPEHYREAIVREFLSNLILSTFLAGLGIAAIGVPVIFRLARSGRGQVGWVLLSSLFISVAFSVLLGVSVLQISGNWLSDFLTLLGYSLFMHILLSLGFSVGAGLPWRMHR